MVLSLILKTIITNLDWNTNKQFVEEILIERAVKTTKQLLYDKGLFHDYANADKVLEDFLFVTRRDSWYLQLFEYLY